MSVTIDTEVSEVVGASFIKQMRAASPGKHACMLRFLIHRLHRSTVAGLHSAAVRSSDSPHSTRESEQVV
jgi:hypothetical protein